MNSVSKPQTNKNKRRRKPVEKTVELPSDRIILDTLYSHYGKPENIVKEKVKLFKEYLRKRVNFKLKNIFNFFRFVYINISINNTLITFVFYYNFAPRINYH